MTRTHDNTPSGIERRYHYATDFLKPEVVALSDEVGANIMVAALISAARDCARTAGMAVCQYQSILIDELGLTNRLRRAMDASDPEPEA
jgi:hypothetical protein